MNRASGAAPASCAIRNALILDPDSAQPLARDILVVDGRIEAVGDRDMAVPQEVPDLDASDRIVIPGLINAHTHSAGNLARSWTEHWTLELHLNGGRALRGAPSLEDQYTSALLGAAEMVSRGCTACYDLVYEFPAPSVDGMKAVGQAYADIGIRAVVAPMFSDLSFYQAVPGLLEAMPADLRKQLERTPAAGLDPIEVLEQLDRVWPFNRELVTLGLAPTIPMHCTDAYLTRLAAFARDHGFNFHTHVAESKVQAIAGQQRYGRSIIAHLEALGILRSNFTAAHCVWIDDDDMKRLAGSGGVVAHCPGCNMRLGSGLAAVRRMLDHGVTVGVGTDSRLASDNLNMFEAMRLASFVSRVQKGDHSEWLTTRESFDLATTGGARALNLGVKLGRIDIGYAADLTFIDAGNLNYVPLNNLMNQIVHAEDATAVTGTMIAGGLAYWDRRFTTIDMPQLRRRAEAAADRLRATSQEALAFAARLEPLVSSFCGGLARGDRSSFCGAGR